MKLVMALVSDEDLHKVSFEGTGVVWNLVGTIQPRQEVIENCLIEEVMKPAAWQILRFFAEEAEGAVK